MVSPTGCPDEAGALWHGARLRGWGRAGMRATNVTRPVACQQTDAVPSYAPGYDRPDTIIWCPLWSHREQCNGRLISGVSPCPAAFRAVSQVAWTVRKPSLFEGWGERWRNSYGLPLPVPKDPRARATIRTIVPMLHLNSAATCLGLMPSLTISTTQARSCGVSSLRSFLRAAPARAPAWRVDSPGLAVMSLHRVSS